MTHTGKALLIIAGGLLAFTSALVFLTVLLVLDAIWHVLVQIVTQGAL